jgi:glycosyltransferase involved in cell wall biosynthesis
LISIVYLGKRGGGATFTKNISEAGLSEGLVNQILISSSNELMDATINSSRITLVPIAHRWRQILVAPFNLLRQFSRSWNWARKTKDDLVVFVMPSPFDLLTMRIIRLFNSKIVFICHEIQHHEGEKWPLRNSIQKRISLSASVVTLSNHVLEQVRPHAHGKMLKLIPHPILELGKMQTPPELLQLKDELPIFLFVGRLKKYKGLEVLLAAWDQVDNGSLIIAGEGELDSLLPPRITLINRWLTDGEINCLINYADFVVFPYTSASQSGLIPSVVNINKNVVASEIAGLTEQLKDHLTSTTWVVPGDVESLQMALNRLAYYVPDRSLPGEINENHKSMIAFLMEIEETWLSRYNYLVGD